MIHRTIVIPLRKKAPVILLPLLTLIVTIASCNTLLSHHYSYPVIAALYVLLAALLVVGSFLTPSLRTIALAMALTVVGGSLRMLNKHHSYQGFPFVNEQVSLQGTVINKELTEQPRDMQCLTLKLQTIKTNNTTWHTNHKILIYSCPTTDIEIADRVNIQAITPKKPNNELFERYLMKEGILATLFIDTSKYVVEYRPTYSIRRWFHTYRQNLVASLKRKLSPSTFPLFASLFLGIKNKKDLELLNQQFKQWGISHYLARSGLHLTVVITIYEALFRFIPLPFMLRQLLLLFLGAIYYLLSWASISFIRAFLMFIYYKLSLLTHVPTHFLHIICATCYLILMVNPFQLFFLDFQLSFLLTAALGWLSLYRTE